MRTTRLLKTELLISRVLRYGVIFCGCVIGLGLFTRLAHVGTVPGSSRATIAALTSGGIVPGGAVSADGGGSVAPPHEIGVLLHGILHGSADVTMAAAEHGLGTGRRSS